MKFELRFRRLAGAALLLGAAGAASDLGEATAKMIEPYRVSSSSNGPVTLYSEGGIGYRFETHWKAEDLVTAADASNTRHTGSSLRAFRDAQERDFILAGAFPSGRSRHCVHRSVTSSGRSHVDRGCVLDARGGGPRSDDGRHAVCDLRREPAGLLCGDL